MDLVIYNIPVLVLAIAFFFQLYYFLFVYLKLRNYSTLSQEENKTSLPVSVIVCARNEEANLTEFLPLILEQDYSNYEVVVVNDCSSDDSEWVLKTFEERYEHLKVVNIKEHERYKHGKKFALTLGIKAAKNEHLVFTDADCKPSSKQWVKHMASKFDEGIEIVIGYSPYIRKRGVLNLLIRFETFRTAMNYLAYSLKKKTYMGVGRNMAYTKSLFFEGKGFASHMHIQSGDDDLFVNQNATKDNTAICIHPDAHVWGIPNTSIRAYNRQKARHHSASKAYKSKHKRMLTTQILSAIVFYAALFICFVLYPYYWQYILGAYLLRLLLQIVLYVPIMKKLKVVDILPFLPILDILYYFMTAINGFLALFKRQLKWK